MNVGLQGKQKENGLHFAVIAAGDGSRLKQEGIACSKPMLAINGVPLIERLLNSCIAHGAASLTCIMNEQSPDLEEFLRDIELPVPLHLIRKSTPSSLHSLYELRVYLKGIPFVLMTTDTIFKDKELSAFLTACKSTEENGVIAVTDFIDDEKPLYALIDENGCITTFPDEKGPAEYVTGGIYYFRNDIFSTAEALLQSGRERLRNLLRELAGNGYRMKAFRFSKMIDVDHVTDIQKAEHFLQDEQA